MRRKNHHKKKFFFGNFFFVIVLLILISGCKGKKDVQKAVEDIRTGTQGLVINFLPNAPPDKIHAEKDAENSFDVILEIKNKGAYPQPGEGRAPNGLIYLSGYDTSIITFEGQNPQWFKDKGLEGKSIINPNGGLDLMTFKGDVLISNLCVEKYEPTLLATACYPYKTVAGPQVCIDPNPYSTVAQKKVCQIGSISLSNQGAPIAVTRIDEEAFAKRTQFKITIKNVGGGDVYEAQNCLKLERNEIDKVYVEGINIGNKPLSCRPFLETTDRGNSGTIRLINGEGFIICELSDYGNADTAYLTPMTIKLSYQYRNTAEKKIQIRREISGEESGACAGNVVHISQEY